MSEAENEGWKKYREEKTKEWQQNMSGAEDPSVAPYLAFSQYEPLSQEDYRMQISAALGEDLAAMREGVVVDIGSGVGSRLHDAMVELGVTPVCLDASESAVRKTTADGKDGVVADAFRLPFADHSLDGIISSNFINAHVFGSHDSVDFYFKNIRDFFQEVARTLKPNAPFIQAHFGGLATSQQIGEIIRELGFHKGTRMMAINDPQKSQAKAWENSGYGWEEPLSFIVRNKN